MTEEELRAHGWYKDEQWDGCMCWRDPLALLSWYTFRDAVALETRRTAETRGMS